MLNQHNVEPFRRFESCSTHGLAHSTGIIKRLTDTPLFRFIQSTVKMSQRNKLDLTEEEIKSQVAKYIV